jgi:hypothetical protein
MPTIGEFVKILKDAAVTCFNLPLKHLLKCSRGTTSCHHVRDIQTESRIQTSESNAVWRSTRLCDFRVFDAI